MKEKRCYYNLRLSISDLEKIEKWGSEKRYLSSWIIRRAVKEFIKKYIDDSEIIEAIEINCGAANDKRGIEWIDLPGGHD